VSDKCSPVCIGVYTGQELHYFVDSTTPNNLPSFDSHNFIEFVYSEKIVFGDGSVAYPTVAEDGSNIPVTSSFGSISNLGSEGSNAGISIAGFAEIAQGALYTGSVDSDGSNFKSSDSTVHAFYRQFATGSTAARASSFESQTHRIRLSIAGYQNGNVSVNGSFHNFWPGFINSAYENVSPSGTVNLISLGDDSNYNDKISDASGNKLMISTVEGHEQPSLTVNNSSSTETLYGKWDLSAPTFANYLESGRWTAEEKDMAEILGVDTTSTSRIDKMEFHFFDNTPKFSSSDEYNWISKRGWALASGLTTDTNTIKAQDIVGGARPFPNTEGAYTTEKNITSGGLRTSTLPQSLSSFSYALIGDDSSSAYDTSDTANITQSVSTTGFFAHQDSPNTIPSYDNLYLSMKLTSSESSLYPIRSNFNVTYTSRLDSNSGGIITDLAGNMMKSVTMESIDRTPPKLNLTLAPVGTKKMMILFSKRLSTKSSDLSVIPSQLELIKYDSSSSSWMPVDSSENSIDTSVSASVVDDCEDGTSICIHLEKDVTLENILNWGIRVKQPTTTSQDPITGLSVFVPKIFDSSGLNYADAGDKHTFSDFGVNVIEPLYAYDNENKILSEGAIRSGQWAVRDFSGTDDNTGRIYADSDITLASETISNLPITMFIDVNPVNSSVSNVYNENTNSGSTLWLPTIVSSIATGANSKAKELTETVSNTNPSIRTFEIPNSPDNAECFGWGDGSKVEFMFRYGDANLIDSDLDGNPDFPLYLFRLVDDDDLGTFDVWHFTLSNYDKQRGGVTILNNVINVTEGEKTVIEVEMPTDGVLSVQVLTLDGNVITNLQRGSATAGTHYYSWNGTNRGGNKVARGLYFVRVVGPGIDETRKVMCVK
ncbi:MAG: FlgD immunoglobulin-like domain containing protein, partial [Treponemataceae bacterium]|nr:FlgD immunoglobulin-like domain containing protein [Treponemataceae bacterium]